MFILAVAVGALAWRGVRYVLDALQHRRNRPDHERLRPDQAPSVADEAQEWLRTKG